jgi:hypothetical protein
MTRFILQILLLFPMLAFAQTPAPPLALDPGVYRSSDGMFAWLKIQNWSRGSLIQGDAMYGNDPFAFEVVVTDIGNGQLSGRSSIIVNYGPLQCSYPIEMLLDVTTNSGFYLRSYMPIQFQTSAGYCPPVQSAWFLSRKPYSKK